jgi:hypothetical protein
MVEKGINPQNGKHTFVIDSSRYCVRSDLTYSRKLLFHSVIMNFISMSFVVIGGL